MQWQWVLFSFLYLYFLCLYVNLPGENITALDIALLIFFVKIITVTHFTIHGTNPLF